MRDFLYALMMILPLALTGPLVCFFIEGVLKYNFRNSKAAYILTTAVSLSLGFLVSFQKTALAVDEVVISINEPLIMTAYLILLLILVFLMEGKVWRRVVVSFLTFDILTEFNAIFTALRELMFDVQLASDPQEVMLINLLCDLLIIMLELFFFIAIGRVRSRNDRGPLPIPVMLAIGFFLSLITNILNLNFDRDLLSTEAVNNFDASKRVSVIFMLTAGLAFIFVYFYVRSTRMERDDLKILNSANEELVESQTKFFEASAEADTKIRAMRHDMRNNIQVLLLLLESGEYDKMRDYLEQMGADLTSADISPHTSDMIADAVITEKEKKASSLGIALNVTGAVGDMEFSPVDTCKMIGNMLDNAIEALSDERLSGLDESMKKIDLVFKRTDKFFMISMTNPCAECPVIKDGMIKTDKSDKKNHGFGLKNIREAASVYGGEVTLSCEEKAHVCVFRTEIVFNLSDKVG